MHAVCKTKNMFRRLSARVKKFWASLALLSVEMIIILVLFIAALATFVYITRKIFVLDKTQFDQNVFAYLKNHIDERNTDIMDFFTFFGTHIFLIPANLVLIAYFAFIKKNKWYSIKFPAIALSSLGLMFGLKALFHRHRPIDPVLQAAKGMSYPSGHALFSMTFYGLLIYLVFKTVKNKPLKWILISLLIIFIFVIGFSRIYLRYHYASDVLAGYCIGFLWLVFAVWLLNKIEKQSKKAIDPIVQKPAPATT